MAEKRMFSKKITESDAFLDMPLSSQCLYFHLNMSADDDGFVNNPKRTMKLIGASDDDLKLLIAKAFVLVFESGVIVIKHWRMNNTLQKDRYKPTDYQEEYALLGLKSNKSYTWKHSGNILDTQNRIDKIRLEEISLDKEKDKDKETNKKENKIIFKKPTLEEVKSYCGEKQLNIDAEYFLDYYEAVDWKVGKNPMKDWKATVRNWARNNKNWGSKNSKQPDYTIAKTEYQTRDIGLSYEEAQRMIAEEEKNNA